MLSQAVIAAIGRNQSYKIQSFSLPAAKARGLSLERAFAKTMLFGFTWWVPLKAGVFDD